MDDVEYDHIRTGDIAIVQKNDFPSMLISFFTFNRCQHSGILAWIDGDVWRNEKTCKFIPNYRKDKNDILTVAHITKRRQFCKYLGDVKSGLVLLDWDEYKSDMLMTMWVRQTNRKEICDKRATYMFEKFLLLNHPILEYENDYKSILGVSVNMPYRPYAHRLICTTMCCEYLKESYNYPFLIKNENDMEREMELSINNNFLLPNRDIEVYRSFDFMPDYNQSPVFQPDSHVVYGTLAPKMYLLKHPFTTLFISLLIITILSIFLLILLKSINIRRTLKTCIINSARILHSMLLTTKGIISLTILSLSIYFIACILTYKNQNADLLKCLDHETSQKSEMQKV